MPDQDRQPFVVSDFTFAGGLENLRDRAVEVHLTLADMEKSAVGPGADPRIIFREGSPSERLWTAHGLIWLDPLLGLWYWVDRPVSLVTLWERWPRYRDYLTGRTLWAIDYCTREHGFCVDEGRESDAYSWGSTSSSLRSQLELAQTAEPLPPAAR